MKKLTKAAIAGAAGIALLLGGAGTLAYWNADATAAGGTITAGELTIVPVGAGAWTDANGPITIADFRAVPGDVLTYTATFDVTAVGDNLTATAALTGDSIAAASASPEDVALAGLLQDSATFTIDGATTTTLTALPGTQQVEVNVTIEWPFDGAPVDDNAAMNGAVSLDDMTITLTQTPTP